MVRIEELKERLRRKFASDMPDLRISFEPSDIVSRVMSLGALTPIEIAVTGPDIAANRDYAEKLRSSLTNVRALRDVQFGQALDYPTVEVTMDRERAGILGITAGRVTRAVTAATSSSRYVVPNYWADSTTGIAYQVQVEVPQQKMNSIEEVKNIPVSTKTGNVTLPLRNLAQIKKGLAAAEYDRFNSQRIVTLTANISGADLGTVRTQIAKALKQAGAPPARIYSEVRGQIVPLQQMLSGLESGLLLAIVVIFLLLAANFQSLKLAFVVVSTAPAVIVGVATALWLTRTTLNIQSFMGAIMAVGVAVANAILLVTFAERSRIEGKQSDAAGIEGARSRLRPILMTSFAFILGVAPLAVATGAGAEMRRSLGREVSALLGRRGLHEKDQEREHRPDDGCHVEDVEVGQRCGLLVDEV